MPENQLCPFYGKNDDYCDVGCGYISPHDVGQIIKFCSCRYTDCLKFQELTDRIPVDEINSVACMA